MAIVAGDPVECLGIPIVLQKEQIIDDRGNPVIDSQSGIPILMCGFSFGGGIDQDNTLSPQKYPDKSIYVTNVVPGGPAERAGLCQHDKILQVNGKDFTMVTHRQAVETVRKRPVLHMLVYRTPL